MTNPLAITGAKLILPVGPPGCGKSTLAQLLVHTNRLHATAVVSPDHFREVLTGSRANQTKNAEAFSICNTIAGARLERGLPVYMDATNLRPSAFIRMVLDTGADLYCVTFPEITLDVLLQRNTVREHPVPEDVIERMWDEYVELVETDLPGIHVTGQTLLYKEQTEWL